MSLAQSISSGFVLATIVLLGVNPQPSLAFAVFSTAALFVSVTWLERKQNTEFDLLVGQVKELKSKVDVLLLAKGMGR